MSVNHVIRRFSIIQYIALFLPSYALVMKWFCLRKLDNSESDLRQIVTKC